jgi:hypothetical protein
MSRASCAYVTALDFMMRLRLATIRAVSLAGSAAIGVRSR